VIVFDASSILEWLLQTAVGQRIDQRLPWASESLHAPHLLDVEVAHALRRLVRKGFIAPDRADEAIADLADLRIRRYPHLPLLPRMWELRHNLSAYDAAYVALAEALPARLVTCDRRLASASGHMAAIEFF